MRKSLACAAIAASASLSFASAARAQRAPLVDRSPPSGSAEKPVAKLVPWHDTWFIWDHSVRTQTFGIGSDYQSANPTYEMMFRLAPRYYFLDRPDASVSVRADVRLIREFTNSDVTTERGEWTFGDSELWLAWVSRVRDVPNQRTDLVVRAPMLLLPTSKASYRSGRVLGLGTGVGVDQEIPLRGAEAKFLPKMLLRPRVNYWYEFVSSKVAVNDELERIRVDPEGRSAPSDQLSGGANPQHLASLSLRMDVSLASQLSLVTDFGVRYAYRYGIPDTRFCAAETGCVDVTTRSNASRWDVVSLFTVALDYLPLEFLEISVGYLNVASQLGANGRRRSAFYSPDARAFLSFTIALDALYNVAHGQTPPEPPHTAAAARGPRL